MALIIFDYPWQFLTLVTNFCSWFIVNIVVVRNNVFFGFVNCFPSYFVR